MGNAGKSRGKEPLAVEPGEAGVEEALRALGRRDSALRAAIKTLPRFPAFPEPANRRRSHYESLARAIIYQQLTGKAAATIFGRVKKLTPGSRFPRPPEIAALSDEELRSAGLSGAKVRALRDLADKVASGELSLRAVRRMSDEEIVASLCRVRGIGVWSAQMFLLFKLGRLDVWPAGDLGVQEGVRVFRGLKERPGPAEVEQLGAAWRPFGSAAAWYCWRVVEAERAGVDWRRPARRR